jgi:PTS system mannose-specific IIA component
MVGVVFVAHENIAHDMVSTAQTILGRELPNFRSIKVPFDVDVEVAREEIETQIKEVDTGDGVLLLTDFLGGTPSNICCSILNHKNIELIYGTNLAMIIKLANCCDIFPLGELASFIKQYGMEHINLVNHKENK